MNALVHRIVCTGDRVSIREEGIDCLSVDLVKIGHRLRKDEGDQPRGERENPRAPQLTQIATSDCMASGWRAHDWQFALVAEYNPDVAQAPTMTFRMM